MTPLALRDPGIWRLWLKWPWEMESPLALMAPGSDDTVVWWVLGSNEVMAVLTLGGNLTSQEPWAVTAQRMRIWGGDDTMVLVDLCR